jgi:hypothetical protein
VAKIRPLTPSEAQRTFAQRFAKSADRLRQLNTNFGMRPYRVFLVWQVWSGSEVGEGDVTTVAECELLPTPLLSTMDAVALDPRSAGILPIGMLRITEVSIDRYTRDRLWGLDIPGVGRFDHIPPLYSFFYEVREDGRGDCPPWRMKYRLANEPHRMTEQLMWQFAIERISEDRYRDGKSAYLTGDRG